MKTIIRWALLAPLLLVSFAWACAALFFDGPFSGLIALAFGCAAVGILGWVRPFRKSLALFFVLFLAVLLWWFSIEPSNDREWLSDVARLPAAEVDGDLIAIRNVRNFVYRSEFDYDERWEERTYDLSKLVGIDVFLIYWGSPWIAHTIMSWVFEDGPPLAISIETRKEVGEEYSAVRGFFRQFEIYYVVSDELDVVRLRTNYRGEDVYLYRLLAPPELARKVLLAYFEEINQLATKPRWYNAFRYNCTTAIRHHVQSVAKTLSTGESSSMGASTNCPTSAVTSIRACPLTNSSGGVTSPSGRKPSNETPNSRRGSETVCPSEAR